MVQEHMLESLTGFQRDLLYVIAGSGKTSGQDVKDELQKTYEEPINHGRLYPNLDTLVDRGLVKKGSIDRRTNSYEITEQGLKAIHAHEIWENQYLPEGF